MEKVGFDDNGDEVELNFGGDGDGGEGKEDENAADKDGKPTKPDDAIEEDHNALGGTDLGAASFGNNPTLENKLRDMANCIIDSAVDTVLAECADMVL